MSDQPQHHQFSTNQQVMKEPGPGAIAVGYVRYSSKRQSPTTLITQKRFIQEFVNKKGWKLTRWYEEPARSASSDQVEQRPVFAQLLKDAGTQFQVVVCYSSDRWSRNVEVAYSSLEHLRKLRVWWATADGLWDSERVQQDDLDVTFALDTHINASLAWHSSKRASDGKEVRARDGYHNGWVPFGYLPPEYLKTQDSTTSDWPPPRLPARPDPVNFPALVKIGELAAQGWTDSAIADELSGYLSHTPRHMVRKLNKDAIYTIRHSWFPREFASGCGHGTIQTPSGELVEGKHQAAWPYDLWQRMVAVKSEQYIRPQKEAQPRIYELRQIVACAACHRPLKTTFSTGERYYLDTSAELKWDCPAGGSLWVKADLALSQLGVLLKSLELPATWREITAERCTVGLIGEDAAAEAAYNQWKELEARRQRLVSVFVKGYLLEQEFDAEMGQLQVELSRFPVQVFQKLAELKPAVVKAGERLVEIGASWDEVTAEERLENANALFQPGGLLYDLERRAIVGLLPQEAMLPVLTLAMEKTGQWEQRDNCLWLRSTYLPPKQEHTHRPPPPPFSLTPEQQREACALVQQGMSLRDVGKRFGTSYESVRRAIKRAAQAEDER